MDNVGLCENAVTSSVVVVFYPGTPEFLELVRRELVIVARKTTTHG